MEARESRIGRGKTTGCAVRSHHYAPRDNHGWCRVLAWISPGNRAGEMKLEVECYSGRKADERPVRFRLDGHEYMVEELLDQWYGPSDTYFKVRADDGNLYILRRETAAPDGLWHLESFRQLKHER